jgi:integrase
VRLHPKTGKPLTLGSVKVYRTTQRHLLNFQNFSGKRIDFDTVDNNFYDQFVAYLLKEKNLSTNALSKNLQVIKLIRKDDTEKGVNKNMAFKGKRFATVSEKSENIYLSEAEILEIYKLDLSQNDRLAKVRDLFIIACHTGMRYSDFSILSSNHINGDYIEITQSKTGDPITIPIHPIVRQILAKYNAALPHAVSNQKTNEYLKEIGQKIPALSQHFEKSMTKGGVRTSKTYKKWELLSTNTARRSFATNEYLRGMESITIMAITGHRTEKTFLKYIKASPNDHAKKKKKQWDTRYKDDILDEALPL